MMDAGGMLREARMIAGLSLRDLAERAETSAATLSMYENGKKEPRLSTLKRLCAAAGADVVIEVRPRLSTVERRSLAVHAAVAERLAADPDRVLSRARANLAKLRRVHAAGGSDEYFDAWARLLEGPRDDIVAVLTSLAQSARDLRSVSPFAGVIPESERRRLIAGVSPR